MEEQTVLGITLHFPTIHGVFNEGAFAAIGSFLSFFFVILFMIWIGYSLFAAFKITKSNGDEKEIETGMTLIKNVWISITWGIVFFVALSVIGSIIGIGNVTQWNYELSQCKSASGGFYFQDYAAAQINYIDRDEMYCCFVHDIKSAPDPYNELGFPDGSGHFIGVAKGSSPAAPYFTDCEKY